MNRQVSPESQHVSVVVIVLGGRQPLERCLRALSHQTLMPVEVIVPLDGSRATDASSIEAMFPFVSVLPVAGSRTYAELRSLGISRAFGGIVAITEDHCIPRPDWCSQIAAEHRASDAPAVGGAVEKLTPDSALNWSFYFADYVRYMNPIADGVAHHLTDCNVSYKRTALDEVAYAWKQEFHENVVHGEFHARGRSLRLSSRIIVDQQRRLSLAGAMWDRYAFGRLFASTRVQKQGLLRRCVFIATTPLLPALLVLRSFAHVRAKRRCTADFIQALPYLLLMCLLWASGELVGYVSSRPEKKLSVQSAHAQG